MIGIQRYIVPRVPNTFGNFNIEQYLRIPNRDNDNVNAP